LSIISFVGVTTQYIHGHLNHNIVSFKSPIVRKLAEFTILNISIPVTFTSRCKSYIISTPNGFALQFNRSYCLAITVSRLRISYDRLIKVVLWNNITVQICAAHCFSVRLLRACARRPLIIPIVPNVAKHLYEQMGMCSIYIARIY
jgi:hypothetical protein